VGYHPPTLEETSGGAAGDTAGERSLVGQVLDGKLRVDSVLGKGGMGAVYRVTHLRTHHQRALKVLHPHIRLHPEALARFLREATVSGQLKSPHVVETLDAGTLADGSYFVLMELLEGEPLDVLIDKGPLPPERIAHLLRQACTALSLAHERGIVHRDIKPDNLFVTRDANGTESVKILDFGIARFRQKSDVLGQVTGDNAILGTPLYMAPEQIGSASTVDGRADVYALGVVLYEALSGRKPYTAESFAELVAHIFDGKQTPLERTAPGLSPRAYEIVGKAMAKRPEDRYQTAAELGAALAELERPVAPRTKSIAPEALAATAISAPAAPTPARPKIPETESRVALPSRSLGAAWVALYAALPVAGLAFLWWSSQSPPAAVHPSDAGVAAAPPDASAPALVHAPIDAGTDASLDAGHDAHAAPATTPRTRRDAGRRVPGGLAGEEEIYGGH
jgi:serine/threonine-protein kinase